VFNVQNGCVGADNDRVNMHQAVCMLCVCVEGGKGHNVILEHALEKFEGERQ